MINWTNIKIDLDSAIKTIEDIDCEAAKLEDNEDKLNYLYLRLHTIEKSLQKDLQKIFETTLPRNYYLTRKKNKSFNHPSQPYNFGHNPKRQKNRILIKRTRI